MNHKNELLKTKLNIPRMFDNSLKRASLLDKLEKGKNSTLTIISAPSGYGKTTLLSQWANKNPVTIGWYSIDKKDVYLNVFFKYFINALKTIKNDFGRDILPLIDVELTEKIDKEYILTLIINELSETYQAFNIILDDYHLIDSGIDNEAKSNEVSEAMTFLIKNAPDNLHLYISTRNNPFPSFLPYLRAKNKLTEIKINELKFNLSEVIDFFRLKHINISSEEAEYIHNNTEGWILSLEMAILSFRDSGNIDKYSNEFSTKNRYLLDHLFGEIINSINDTAKNFLLKTSILNKFNYLLANFIIEDDNGQEIIEHLENLNMFIIPLDAKKEWYRYHQTFAELLKDALKRNHPEMYYHVNKRASEWYKKEGRLVDSINYSFLTEDADYIISQLEENSINLIINNREDQLKEFFERLPKDKILSNIILSIFYAWIMADNYQLDYAEKILIDTEAKIKSISYIHNLPVTSIIYNIYLKIALKRSNINVTLKYAKRLHVSLTKDKREDLIYDDIDLNLLASSYYYEGYAYFISGNIKKATNTFRMAEKYYKKSDNILYVIKTNSMIANMLMTSGEVYKAESLLLDLLTEANEHQLNKHHYVFLILVDIARIYSFWNDREKAYKYINMAKEISGSSSSALIYFYINYISICLSFYEINKIEDIYPEIEKFVEKSRLDTFYSSFINDISVILNIHKKEYEKVNYWAEKTRESLEDRISDYQNINMLEIFNIYNDFSVLVNYYLSTNNLKLANYFINLLLECLQNSPFNIVIIQVLIFNAITLQRMGYKDNALSSFKKAIVLAEKNNLLIFFLNKYYYDDIKTLLIYIQGEFFKKLDRVENKFLEEILPLYNITVEKINKKDILSQRELEIIEKMREYSSYQKIGDELFLSLNTVKTHVKNIYKKLDVKTREEALNKAIDLRFIS